MMAQLNAPLFEPSRSGIPVSADLATANSEVRPGRRRAATWPPTNFTNFEAEKARARARRAARARTEQLSGPTSTDCLKTIKSLSALTWDGIATLMGTSTRAVHLWRSGKPITNANEDRLRALAATLSYIDPGSGLAMKALFSKSDNEDGHTVYDMLKNGEFDRVREFVGRGRGRTKRRGLTTEEQALFTPLPVAVLINQHRFATTSV